MTDDFILSQMHYYRRNLRSGPSRDWNLISGNFQYYQNEARRRGLL